MRVAGEPSLSSPSIFGFLSQDFTFAETSPRKRITNFLAPGAATLGHLVFEQ